MEHLRDGLRDGSGTVPGCFRDSSGAAGVRGSGLSWRSLLSSYSESFTVETDMPFGGLAHSGVDSQNCHGAGETPWSLPHL